jgi:hypothetical protein
MGNDNSHHYEFERDEWQLVEKNPSHALWRSRHDSSIQIEQYELFSRGNEDYKQEKEVFQYRHLHKQMVSAVYFQELNEN